MQLNHVIIIWSACLSLNFIVYGYSVTCYLCHNKLDPQCTELDPPVNFIETYTKYRTDANNRLDKSPGCIKTMRTNKTSGEMAVFRAPVVESNSKPEECTVKPNSEFIIVECFCWSNYCNGTKHLNSNISKTLVTICILCSMLFSYLRK